MNSSQSRWSIAPTLSDLAELAAKGVEAAAWLGRSLAGLPGTELVDDRTQEVVTDPETIREVQIGEVQELEARFVGLTRALLNLAAGGNTPLRPSDYLRGPADKGEAL